MPAIWRFETNKISMQCVKAETRLLTSLVLQETIHTDIDTKKILIYINVNFIANSKDSLENITNIQR